eukprot:6179443-Pleurochrysis_carterae.AAC.1
MDEVIALRRARGARNPRAPWAPACQHETRNRPSLRNTAVPLKPGCVEGLTKCEAPLARHCWPVSRGGQGWPMHSSVLACQRCRLAWLMASTAGSARSVERMYLFPKSVKPLHAYLQAGMKPISD